MAPSVRVNGQVIRRLREQRGIERRELALSVGVTPHRVYEIEVRDQRTTPTTLRRIAAALSVPPDRLVHVDALADAVRE